MEADDLAMNNRIKGTLGTALTAWMELASNVVIRCQKIIRRFRNDKWTPQESDRTRSKDRELRSGAFVKTSSPLHKLRCEMFPASSPSGRGCSKVEHAREMRIVMHVLVNGIARDNEGMVGKDVEVAEENEG
jgi:hypothetical protein